jgi:hypothetical protein
MAFADLARFITREMRMSHVCQPVMLLALLRNGGRLPASAIAGEAELLMFLTLINAIGYSLSSRYWR